MFMKIWKISDTKSNKRLSHIVTELLFRGRKLNISLIVISQSYFKVPKGIGLNAMLIKKNFNK